MGPVRELPGHELRTGRLASPGRSPGRGRQRDAVAEAPGRPLKRRGAALAAVPMEPAPDGLTSVRRTLHPRSRLRRR
ncbi:protein of unknown function [Streptomyces sp. KY75]|nr:protein of unknown function [Streptomyces sp. KY75]CAD5980139.1 protein of unknown function [Streptomyces sp. KY70]